ncbi:transporter substrate-binding domain-containing protein [Undibacterium sp. CCC2.1]|uniref:transporter substrate-binding domain-containing protein n=1 Tax=unclassified Undibacterium TaxID=2630295 RepID=UPI002B22BD61|nr:MULTISPECIES: transporter substrate-binding domain-containing protein [unclassified Undibacterium]MEB0140581.1 transporter substrate-binding domain-containing protein [Undibacterium sp. CCC2.1]MEB0173635.1 transporter substrate-binding domain-containing protein [Undibacterium sp. CCC1.1]MEB0177347.1 transporter substrate-binding domain-containing protein [Undibacterium sp. CCC3.4]
MLHTAAQEASAPKFIALSGSAQGAVGGLCIDILRALEKQDPELRFQGDQVWQPRLRIERAMADGQLDVFCGVQKNRRNRAHYQWLETPLFEVDYLLAVRADDTVAVANWEDIRRLGKDGVILALYGFGVVDRLEQLGGLQVDASATSSLSNLKKLRAGRARFYCHRSPGIKNEISKAGMSGEIRLLERPQLHEIFYMGLALNLRPEVVAKLAAALRALKQNGELKRLADRYAE